MKPKRTLIVEHKTTSKDITPGSPYWQSLDIDDQVSTYVGATKALGIDTPIDGVLYDVVKKPQLKPKQGDKRKKEAPETPDEFEARCLNDMAEDPSVYFARGTIVRLAGELVNAARDQWGTAMLIEFSKQQGFFPRSPGSCEKWGRFCDFFDVCTNRASLTDTTRYVKKTPKTARKIVDVNGKVTFDDSKRHLTTLSASSLSSFRTCPRLYQYQYVDGYKPLGEGLALTVGSAWHKALEHWWMTLDLDGALRTFDPKTDAELEAMDPRDRPKPLDAFERAKLRAMMRGYDAMWREEQYDVLAVEREFYAPLLDPMTGDEATKYDVTGRIDALVTIKEEEKGNE